MRRRSRWNTKCATKIAQGTPRVIRLSPKWFISRQGADINAYEIVAIATRVPCRDIRRAGSLERIRTPIRNGAFRPTPPSAAALVPVLTVRAFAEVWKAPRGCDAYAFGEALGRRVKSVQEAWTNARKVANLADVQLGDRRHEAASRLDEAGVPTCRTLLRRSPQKRRFNKGLKSGAEGGI